MDWYRRARRFVDNLWDPDDVPWLAAGLVLIALLLLGFAIMLDYSALDVWTATIVFLVLVAVSAPLFQRVARAEGDERLFRILMLALLAKFAGSMARYFMIFVLYGGSGDAGRYHEAGVMFANRLRDGVAIHPIPIMEGFPVETQRIGDAVGGLYVLTGASAYAGFLVFSYLCFWGQVFMYRGFKAAVPEGDHRRYALLVLFLPSLLFWPSSLGKEALIVFCLGLTIYGAGLLLGPQPRLRGAAFFAAGTLLVLLVRPHVAVMSIGGLVLAMAVGLIAGFGGSHPADDGRLLRAKGRGRAIRILALVVLIGLAVGASSRLGEVFGDEDGSVDAQSVLADAQRNSAQGGSEYQPIAVTGPQQLPAAVVSVYFRPFFWEARNVSSLLAGAESLLLFGLVIANWRRVANVPRMALRRPFLIFCGAYVLVFAVGFSYIANFGILARQRVQALPILLMVLALPPVGRGSFGKSVHREEDGVLVADSVDSMTEAGRLRGAGSR